MLFEQLLAGPVERDLDLRCLGRGDRVTCRADQAAGLELDGAFARPPLQLREMLTTPPRVVDIEPTSFTWRAAGLPPVAPVEPLLTDPMELESSEPCSSKPKPTVSRTSTY
jgi:hypothetical protein